jgi:hypothetical protein
MSLTPAQADAINRSVKFLPQKAPCTSAGPDGPVHNTPCTCGSRPALDVAGVQVYAYVDPEVGLRISVHFEEARHPLIKAGERAVPCRVDLGGAHAYLYESTAEGVEYVDGRRVS